MPVKKAERATPNLLLRRARQERGWPQEHVALQIGAQTFMVNRWERGTSSPSNYYRQKLCDLFGKSAKDLGLLPKESLPAPFDPLAPVYDPAIPLAFADAQDFVGRSELLIQLKQLLRSSESVILTALNGLPGVGKTALAVELANDSDVQEYFRDGILWANLGPHPNVLGKLSRWGKLLGVSEAEIGRSSNDDTWAMVIRTALGKRRMLLVIDDAWKIEEALAFELGGPHCAYLVTTRISDVAMHFAREKAILVPELSEDHGLTLLARLAPTAVQAEPETARALVRSVGGLPLALTLIGGYLLIQGRHNQRRRIRAALAKLQNAEERLNLAQPQGGVKRHPGLPQGVPISLQTVIGISGEALDEASRQALQALSAFPAKPNTFSEEAAVAVAATSTETLDRLVDSGLVEASGQDRYALHQTIADYEHLKNTGTAAEERMAEYFANYVEAHKTDYSTLEQENANILAALESAHKLGKRPELIRGVSAWMDFLKARGLYVLAEQQLQMAYKAATALGDTQGKVSIFLDLGSIEEKRGNYRQAEAFLQEGLVLARQLGDRKRICTLLRTLGMVTVNYKDYTQAETYYQEGLALARQLGDQEEISAFLINLGTLVTALGNYIQAETYQQEALALARQIKKPEWIMVLLLNRGELISKRGGSVQEEESYYQEGLALARELGHRRWICALLNNLGAVAIKQGDYVQAKAYLQEGLSLARQIGHLEQSSYLLANLGGLAREAGDYELAEAYMQEGLALARQIEKRELVSSILSELGEVYFKQHQLQQAEAVFREMRELIPEGNQELSAQALYGLARVAAAHGSLIEARVHAQASLAVFEAIGHSKSVEVRQWINTLPIK